MTEYFTRGTAHAAIEERLEATIGRWADDRLAPARRTIDACEDRWFGRLLVHSFEASVDPGREDRPIAAAAATELLRGYCRLRGELVAGVAGRGPPRSRRERTAILLAGDHLFASAFATLEGDASRGRMESCFEVFTAVSETIVETYAMTSDAESDPRVEYPLIVDHTAGVLGECAAVVGAAIGGADASLSASFATVGRGYAAARELARGTGGDVAPLRGLASSVDSAEHRGHAERRRRTANRALANLPPTIDDDVVRRFVERTVEDDRVSR